jgi:hypothetical protein
MNTVKNFILFVFIFIGIVILGYLGYTFYNYAIRDATAKIKEGVSQGVSEGIDNGISGALNPLKLPGKILGM